MNVSQLVGMKPVRWDRPRPHTRKSPATWKWKLFRMFWHHLFEKQSYIFIFMYNTVNSNRTQPMLQTQTPKHLYQNLFILINIPKFKLEMKSTNMKISNCLPLNLFDVRRSTTLINLWRIMMKLCDKLSTLINSNNTIFDY